MDALTSLYENYLTQLGKAAAKMRPGDGLFGMGRKLSDDVCHDNFIEDLEAYLAGEADASPEKANEILKFIYKAHIAYPEAHSSAYWMMLSAHKLTVDLICRLQEADAQELLIWYLDAFPREDRLIPQKQVIQELKKRCGNTGFLPAFRKKLKFF